MIINLANLPLLLPSAAFYFQKQQIYRQRKNKGRNRLIFELLPKCGIFENYHAHHLVEAVGQAVAVLLSQLSVDEIGCRHRCELSVVPVQQHIGDRG